MSTSNAERFLTSLLSGADIRINGNRPFDIQVKDDRFFERVIRDGALGAGESYMDGWWEAEQLDETFNKILRARLDEKLKGASFKTKWHLLRSRLFNLQNLKRSRQVAEQHYDLGNNFYEDMLGPTMNYTCAFWKDGDDLDQAQRNKMEMVCQKLELKPGMKILELGCGWGAFAKYAAENYGAKVTAYNISTQQVEYARKINQGLPVKIIQDDYRKAAGEFDRVLSIGIMEHVGYKNYRHYMELVNRTLKDDGIAFVHTIGNNVSGTTANAWTTKYIFPNGMLPSIAQLSKAMEGLFVIEDIQNIGPHYDPTLMAWYHNFEQNWPKYQERYGDRFYRMWRYYLLSSAGGFRSRQTQLWQIVFTKPGRKLPGRVCL
ncbi:MAG: cyclopropane fatty acyl phospholipid synthase [Calditrichia bacterium]